MGIGRDPDHQMESTSERDVMVSSDGWSLVTEVVVGCGSGEEGGVELHRRVWQKLVCGYLCC